MKPQSILGRASTPDGKELVLYERDGVFSIRVNGLELMSSRAHGSEEALARLALEACSSPSPSVLVGGLGMGYTLRAVIDAAPKGSRIAVAEIFPAVVAWNRSELAHLADSPVLDPGVKIVEADVAEVIGGGVSAFDVVLLDVDNGPDAFTLARNEHLYGKRGLAMIRRCLRKNGILGVWSADPDRAFERRLAAAGFQVRIESVHARPGTKGPRHTIFIARMP